TTVLVSTFRSRHGAAFEIFRRLRLGEWTVVVSNHLLFEYEEILKRDAPLLGLSLADVDATYGLPRARSFGPEEFSSSPNSFRGFPNPSSQI
ncbi:MAG: PIN domain-containing protein, partial [Verrucomicrobiota bacterium]